MITIFRKQTIIHFCTTLLFIFCFQFSYANATTDSTNTDDLDHILAKLVSFQTVSDDKKTNQAALDWIKQELSGLPLIFKNFDSNGVPSMIITTRNTKNPKLWLVAHVDVVPADRNMFTMTTKGGHLVGRGVLDMKLGVASYMKLLKDIGEGHLKDYDMGIMLTCDEEVGGMNGVRYLLENQGYRGQLGFLPDGGFNWQIEEAAKGILWVKFKVNGVASHGSRPWLGVNAINNLVIILDNINSYFNQVKTAAINKDYYTTINVGLIRGGMAVNQVPAHAEATVDVRYTPDFDVNQLIKRLDRIVNTVPNASYEILLTGKPNHLNLELSEVKKFKELAMKMYGIKVGATKSHGATDARFFSAKNIPVLIVAPIGANIHSNDEWMDKDDFHRFYDVFKAWALDVGRASK